VTTLAKPVATVVVPTYNGAKKLPATLAAIIAQQCDIPFEVVVVDDGSTDGTPTLLEEWRTRHPERVRAFSQVNSGPGRARNRGAAEARGSFIAFVDDDCVPDPAWLARLWAANQSAPGSAIAGRVVNPSSTWIGRYVVREHVIDHVVSDGTVTEAITGNLGVEHAMFARVGGFNEAIRVAGGEDTQFSVQLRASGVPIIYEADAVVHHDRESTVRSHLAMIYRHGRGRTGMGDVLPEYRITWAPLRLLWVLWPVRRWMARDYRRYTGEGVPPTEALEYVMVRYAENIVRLAGYLRESIRS
jgi:glycosyltransferase involved in cell wall biosynthesis